ncbi:hypothetical protein [Candidatus Dactylopiibacterium carminicum]|uniref:hypothetical protein n=1 Tax=Candidatus Dactylopiibacterium carminicum TaxID=857335 RepID=UPI001CC29D34|nr:hypothetical protein [Candidatus Dactylopiibacterium carminicum]
MIKTLDRIQTESHHAIQHNADAARAEVMSLNGMHTTSTHTIYVTKVETNVPPGDWSAVRAAACGTLPMAVRWPRPFPGWAAAPYPVPATTTPCRARWTPAPS